MQTKFENTATISEKFRPMALTARDENFNVNSHLKSRKGSHLTLINGNFKLSSQERFKHKIFSFFKRAQDLIFGSIMLVFALPVMALTALIIKLTSPGPILIKQKRLTMNGRVFTIYKFRSMTVNAESKTGPVMASQNDPRVTKFGRFMRKSRLDELPQLINVLKGDMSLVGPRPERPEIAVTLAKEFRGFERRVNVKAGLTGLAQVKADYASELEGYKKKLALDLLYTRRQSLLLDAEILIRTVSVVLLGKGAR